MASVFSSDGLVLALERAFRSALETDEDYILRLFISNTTPTEADVVEDYTEATFDGYESKTLTRAGFDAAAYADGVVSMPYGTEQEWISTGTPNTVYGYYICRASNNALIWAERFGQSRTIVEGDKLRVTPSISSDNV